MEMDNPYFWNEFELKQPPLVTLQVEDTGFGKWQPLARVQDHYCTDYPLTNSQKCVRGHQQVPATVVRTGGQGFRGDGGVDWTINGAPEELLPKYAGIPGCLQIECRAVPAAPFGFGQRSDTVPRRSTGCVR